MTGPELDQFHRGAIATIALVADDLRSRAPSALRTHLLHELDELALWHLEQRKGPR